MISKSYRFVRLLAFLLNIFLYVRYLKVRGKQHLHNFRIAGRASYTCEGPLNSGWCYETSLFGF